MSAVSAFDSSSGVARAPARRALSADDSLSRAQAELELRGSELRRLREALREETRRREAAEAALAAAQRQHGSCAGLPAAERCRGQVVGEEGRRGQLRQFGQVFRPEDTITSSTSSMPGMS